MSEPERKISWYARAELVVIYVLSSILLVGLVISYGHRKGWFSPTPEIIKANPGEFDYRIDLNSAGWSELTLLPGIGEVRARQIIQFRETHGPFKKPDDLLAVPGISSTILKKVVDHVAIADSTTGRQSRD